MVDVAAIGAERRAPRRQPPDDHPERVDDRDRRARAGRRRPWPSRGSPGPRARSPGTSPRPCPGRSMPGGSSSAGTRAGRPRARSTGPPRAAGRPGAVRLRRPRTTAAISAMPRREAVEPVDEVEAVDHPDDPDDREGDPDGDRELDVAGAERVADERHDDARGDGHARERELAEELPPGAEVEAVVEGADHASRGSRRRRGPPGSSGVIAAKARHPGRSALPRATIPPPTTRNARATATPPPRGSG